MHPLGRAGSWPTWAGRTPFAPKDLFDQRQRVARLGGGHRLHLYAPGSGSVRVPTWADSTQLAPHLPDPPLVSVVNLGGFDITCTYFCCRQLPHGCQRGRQQHRLHPPERWLSLPTWATATPLAPQENESKYLPTQAAHTVCIWRMIHPNEKQPTHTPQLFSLYF